ncbi:MAG: aldose 1-epimerase family protein, partial [Chloroflexi bacterium]|nr:aldose 1-epimerase family protein [Chloroflexota bacterium]
AEGVWVDGGWRGEVYEAWARGRMRQAVVFGENVTLTRRVSACLGESRLLVRDVVVNEGYATVPHMQLYHCNLGFPLLDAGTQLVAPSATVTPRDPVAAAGMDNYATYEGPTEGYAEQCFYHEMVADADGWVTVMLANRAFDGGRGLGLYLRYRQDTLPRFTQWKMVGQGDYVTGLEPANCLVEGRDKERARGSLQFLEPGESRDYQLEFGVLDGLEAIDSMAAAIGAQG